MNRRNRKTENISGPLGLRGKRTRRLGVLLISTLLIVSASALVYSRVVYEKALDIGGVTGSGSAGLNPAPETVLTLAVLAFVISFSMFGFLRELSKRKNKTHIRESSPGVSVPAPSEGQEVPEVVLPLRLPPILGEWEETAKEDDKN